MEQIAIRKHFSYFKTTSEEIDNSVFDERLEHLDAELKDLFKKYGVDLIESETLFLPIKKLSIYHCEQCGHLMVNRDQNPTRFDNNELYDNLEYVVFNGGTHDGKNLCEECLPPTHRWGHNSQHK